MVVNEMEEIVVLTLLNVCVARKGQPFLKIIENAWEKNRGNQAGFVLIKRCTTHKVERVKYSNEIILLQLLFYIFLIFLLFLKNY